MRTLLTALTLCLAAVATGAYAKNPAHEACKAHAADKKLAGAAKTSYMTKCEKDAAPAVKTCEGQAAEKKLAGAAKSSFVTKCTREATAPAAAAPAASAAK